MKFNYPKCISIGKLILLLYGRRKAFDVIIHKLFSMENGLFTSNRTSKHFTNVVNLPEKVAEA